MTSSLPETLVQKAVNLLQNAKHIVALTGAGISTPSGIPDFRSPGSGLWERFDPMEVASITAFRYQPERFFEWMRPLVKNILKAEPNPAHIALARLEQSGRLAGIVTQNIDDLHQRAGSKLVLEMHGHMREATCISCYKCYSTDGRIEEYVQTGIAPRCLDCQGLLKPKVVLYGEQLPHEVVFQAQDLFIQSDLILVAGSSLEVTPVASFPIDPLNAGAGMIIVNEMPTYLDEHADVIFHNDLAEVLPRLADEVLGE